MSDLGNHISQIKESIQKLSTVLILIGQEASSNVPNDNFLIEEISKKIADLQSIETTTVQRIDLSSILANLQDILMRIKQFNKQSIELSTDKEKVLDSLIPKNVILEKYSDIYLHILPEIIKKLEIIILSLRCRQSCDDEKGKLDELREIMRHTNNAKLQGAWQRISQIYTEKHLCSSLGSVLPKLCDVRNDKLSAREFRECLTKYYEKLIHMRSELDKEDQNYTINNTICNIKIEEIKTYIEFLDVMK